MAGPDRREAMERPSPETASVFGDRGMARTNGDPPETDRVLVVLVTGPDAEMLVELGRTVVEERLAACANVLDGIASVFRWEGEVKEEGEALALLKTTTARAEELRRRVLELHPYDVPEFLALAVDVGSRSYTEWVASSVGQR